MPLYDRIREWGRDRMATAMRAWFRAPWEALHGRADVVVYYREGRICRLEWRGSRFGLVPITRPVETAAVETLRRLKVRPVSYDPLVGCGVYARAGGFYLLTWLYHWTRARARNAFWHAVGRAARFLIARGWLWVNPWEALTWRAVWAGLGPRRARRLRPRCEWSKGRTR